MTIYENRNKLFATLMITGLIQLCDGYKVEFDPNYSPPSVETEECKELKYSLPVNRPTSVPVVAVLVHNSGQLADGQVSFDVESIPVKQENASTYEDEWLNNGGQLCQYRSQDLAPGSFQQKHFKLHCEGGNKLTGFQNNGDKLVVPRLVHFYNSSMSLSTLRRVYRFIVHVENDSSFTAETNQFIVHSESVYRLVLTGQPVVVRAGQGFNVTVRVVDAEGQTVKQGADSCLYADLQLARTGNSQMRLQGSEILGESTGTVVIRQQMEGGETTFHNIKLLDVTIDEGGVVLNITSYMQSFPYTRIPDDYSDLVSMVTDEDHEISSQKQMSSRAVALSNPIVVTAQTAYQLVIVTKATIRSRQAASFPIEDPIVVEVRDVNGQRIFSGPDASLIITVAASRGKLSIDASFTTTEGRGTFEGSVVTAVNEVVLTFSATSKISNQPIIGDETLPFTVVAEVHIGHFVNLQYFGGFDDLGQGLDTFVHLAEEDVNAGLLDLPGFKDRRLRIHTYDTWNDPQKTIQLYEEMKQNGQADPVQKVRAVMGFGSNTLSHLLQPLLTRDKIPQLATHEDLHDFSNKTRYPYFSRICWEESASAHSVLMAAATRQWTHILIVRSIDFEVSKVIYEKAFHFGIRLSEVVIPRIAESEFEEEGFLSEEIVRVKAAGTKIVWVFCKAPQLWKLIREAIIGEVTPMHGYQWLIMGDLTWEQPFNNQIHLCTQEPICTVALRGLQGFVPTYRLAHKSHHLWRHVLDRYNTREPWFYPDPPTNERARLPGAMAQMMLGYDAVMMYARAINDIIQEDATVSGPALTEQLRQVAVNGFTGVIKLDQNGNRPGYFGFIVVTDPHPPRLGADIAAVAVVARYIELESDTAPNQLEILAELQYPLSTIPICVAIYGSVNPYAQPKTPYRNKYRYNTTNEVLDMYGQGSLSGLAIQSATGEAVAPFYCVAGCGGMQIDSNINQYQHGQCVAMDVCKCYKPYFGPACEQTSVLFPGRVSKNVAEEDSCDSVICSSSQLAAVIGVPIVVLLILLALTFGLCRCYRHRQSLRKALARLDWRVHWDTEIETGLRALPMNVTEHKQTEQGCFVLWRGRKCFSRTYPCHTLDVNNQSLRLEIVRLQQMQHKNIIKFVGACLEWPHVSILTEPAAKGSLKEVLSQRNMKLSWDFKYSILLDICRGMTFLHRSPIKSHGCLMSTNCLIDNKWTCKISEFGVPSIRFGKSPSGQRPSDVYSGGASDLLWTAPELLQAASCLDDVMAGTKAGDVYSFSIIMTEVISRAEPYMRELVHLTPEDIVTLIRDKNGPMAARALKKWEEMGEDTTRWFRPKIDENALPEDYIARMKLKQLVEQTWHETPRERPTFQQSLDSLSHIYPIQGELIDNLVNMLDKYSSNLEATLAERVKELSYERSKYDEFVRQMLPNKLVEDLTNGRPIGPESYQCITLYFSDLMGFTKICRESKPLQIVNLLNDIYTTFDMVLEIYDVYKVETIGDAFMVGSGLPEKNGDLHASIICNMALDLMAAMLEFKVRHQPKASLYLRAGVHSGPCVAGVVGLKVPKYCLFGDTVNTASHMEATSQALRTHVSERTVSILEKFGEFQVQLRDDPNIKVCDQESTYWLVGREGFKKPLPTQEQIDQAATLVK